MTRTSKTILAAALLGAILTLGALRSAPSHAQLLVLTENYTVTEVRPDKNRIGVTSSPGHTTRAWVDVNGKTRVSTRRHTANGLHYVMVPVSQMWSELKPGMRIKVHGGMDWDQHLVAKKVWF